jgi:hypothetical protein
LLVNRITFIGDPETFKDDFIFIYVDGMEVMRGAACHAASRFGGMEVQSFLIDNETDFRIEVLGNNVPNGTGVIVSGIDYREIK